MKQTYSRYTKFELDSEEAKKAKQITIYTWAYLQTKMAEYADAIMEYQYDVDQPNLTSTVIECEKMKARVEMLEELMREFDIPQEFKAETPQTQS